MKQLSVNNVEQFLHCALTIAGEQGYDQHVTSLSRNPPAYWLDLIPDCFSQLLPVHILFKCLFLSVVLPVVSPVFHLSSIQIYICPQGEIIL